MKKLLFFFEIILLVLIILECNKEPDSIILPNGYVTFGKLIYSEEPYTAICIKSNEKELEIKSRITGIISCMSSDKDTSYCTLTIETSGKIKEYHLMIDPALEFEKYTSEAEIESGKEELKFLINNLSVGDKIIIPTIRKDNPICSCKRKSAIYYFIHPKLYEELLESDYLSLDEIDFPLKE